MCEICGIVVQEKVEDESINQLHIQQPGSTRAEFSSLAYFDMGLFTKMGEPDRDARGQIIEPSIHFSIKRLRNWDHRIQLHGGKDINLKRAFSLLYTLSGKLNLSDTVIEKAAYLYRKALLKKMTKGRSIEPLLTAAVYIAIREALSPRSLNDIADISSITLKTLARTVRLLVSELDIVIPAADLYLCVMRIGNISGLSEKTKREAFELIFRIKGTEYAAGKNPMGLAAAAVYIACIKNSVCISQKQIAKAAAVTEVTLRSRMRELKAKKLV